MQNQSGYITAFDIVRDGYQDWWGTVFGAAVAVGAFALSRFGASNWDRRARTLVTAWISILALALALGTFWTGYSRYRSVRHKLQRGTVSVKEGVVNEFIPARVQRPARRGVFVVNGKRFEYGSGDLTGGYATGPLASSVILRRGQHVRVFFVGNAIVRIDTVRNE